MQRTFTLAEAQALVPVLERLLQTAIDCRKTIESVDEEFQTVLTRVLMNGGVQLDPIRLAARKAEKHKAAQQMKDALEEIDASGVQVKDLEIGLLDFPCVVEGRTILLCWKLGESAIEHWHTIEDGFAGRKKIDPSMFTPGARPRLN